MSTSSICALGRENGSNTCFDKNHIETISKYTTAETISDIKKETRCADDICIIQSIDIPVAEKMKIEREAFKTKAESLDGNYWINNTEIDSCMSQLRRQFPGFAHTFIHMSDLKSFLPSDVHTYDYKVYPLTEIDLPECINAALHKSPCGKLSTFNDSPLKSIGIVFNTDTSKGSGQHWFAVYISMDQPDENDSKKNKIVIEVFNSAGVDITQGSFQEYWTKQRLAIAKVTNHTCEYKLVSNIPHQRDDTGNCGAYSLYYIYRRLKGDSPRIFNNAQHKITDDAMQKFRSVLFRVS